MFPIGILPPIMPAAHEKHARPVIVYLNTSDPVTMFPIGNAMKTTVRQIGECIRATRKLLGVTQRSLALTSGTGLRFIIELEQGKPTCQIGKALHVVNTLGIDVRLTLPAAPQDSGNKGAGV